MVDVPVGSIIKIKRSGTHGAPSAANLKVGELAYSYLSAEVSGGGAGDNTLTGLPSNGGDRLYIGVVNGNNDALVDVIGGKYFTSMLDHARGTLTASSAIIVDSNSKINQIKTTNITFGGSNQESGSNSIVADGSLNLVSTGYAGSAGGGSAVWIGYAGSSDAYFLPRARAATTGFVLTGNSDGTTSWAQPSTELTVTTQTGNEITVDLIEEKLDFAGDGAQGLYTTTLSGTAGYSGSKGNTVIISASNAGYEGSKGVASFNDSDFSITDGYVSVGGSIAKLFKSGTAYIGSNAATPLNGEISFNGDTTSGTEIQTTPHAVTVYAKMASTSGQRGTASFSSSFFSISEGGDVSSLIATKTQAGVAAFPDTLFTINGTTGAIDILDATTSTAATNPSRKGIAYYDGTHFDITTGKVSAKTTHLGSTELELGDESGVNDTLKGLAELQTGNIKISGHKIEAFDLIDPTTNPDIDIVLKPLNAGKVRINDTWYLPNEAGEDKYVLTYKADNNTTEWKPIAATFNLTDGTTNVAVPLLNRRLEVKGDTLKGTTATTSYEGSSVATLTISASYAGYTGSTAESSATGVASFYSDTFVKDANGGINVKAAGISNNQLANSSFNIGTTTMYLGSSSTIFGGLDKLTFTNNLSIEGYSGSHAYIIGSDKDLILKSTNSKYVRIGSSEWALPNSGGNNEEVLTSDGLGGTSWGTVPRTQYIATDGYTGSFKVGTDVLTIVGDGPIYTDFTGSSGGNNNTLHINVDLATSTQLGVASFSDADFVVLDGDVELIGTVLQSVSTNSGVDAVPYAHNLKIYGYTGSETDPRAGAISTVGYIGTAANGGAKIDIVARLAGYTGTTGVASFNSSNFTVENGGVSSKKITIGSTDINLGDSPVTTIAGLTDVTISNLQIHNGNEIGYVGSTTGDIILKPAGSGSVSVNNARITNVANPSSGTDAINKNYADSLVSGLDVKLSVRAATNAALTATYADGPGTLTNNGALVALSGGLIDGVTLALGDRVLVKDQGITTDGLGAKTAGADSVQNGIYTVTTLGSGSASWVLTRADDSNSNTDVTPGMFTFVEEGTAWADSGFILITNGAVTLGTTYLTYTQFSAAGQTIAGNGLTKVGDTINIIASTGSGLTVNADSIQISSTIAGDALTWAGATGVLDVKYDNYSIGYTGSSGYTGSLGAGNPITGTNQLRIKSDWPGQTSISTVGTITVGTWNGSVIGVDYGGTGQTSFAKGDMLYGTGYAGSMGKLPMSSTKYQVLRVSNEFYPEWSDIDGGEY